jgi:hypothetical protein
MKKIIAGRQRNSKMSLKATYRGHNTTRELTMNILSASQCISSVSVLDEGEVQDAV